MKSKIVIPGLTERAMADHVAQQHKGLLFRVGGQWLVYDKDSGRFIKDQQVARRTSHQPVEILEKCLEEYKKQARVSAPPAICDPSGTEFHPDEVEQAIHKLSKASRKGDILQALGFFHPEIEAKPASFDSHDHLLGCSNGVLNLRTGKLHQHNSELKMAKSTNVEHIPNAVPERFLNFLRQISCEDGAWEEYLQIFLGYCMTGLTTAQTALFMVGSGANGKSVLIRAVASVLGEYAATTPYRTFLASNSNQTGNDIRRLEGIRFASVVETNKTEKLNEAVFKEMTGGDTQCARFLYQEFVEFNPKVKLVFAVNHMPIVSTCDFSIQRRIKCIPFDAVFKGDQDNKKMAQELQKEKPAILSWLIEGAQKWFENGLDHYEPQRVKDRTKVFFMEMDPVGQFLNEKTKDSPGRKIPKTVLLNAFNAWAKSEGHTKISSNGFSRTLNDKGFKESRTNSRRYWKDLELIP